MNSATPIRRAHWLRIPDPGLRRPRPTSHGARARRRYGAARCDRRGPSRLSRTSSTVALPTLRRAARRGADETTARLDALLAVDGPSRRHLPAAPRRPGWACAPYDAARGACWPRAAARTPAGPPQLGAARRPCRAPAAVARRQRRPARPPRCFSTPCRPPERHKEPTMQTLNYRVPGRPAACRARVHVGVVGSGDLEILLDPADGEPRDRADVRVAPASTGSTRSGTTCWSGSSPARRWRAAGNSTTSAPPRAWSPCGCGQAVDGSAPDADVRATRP